MNARHIGPPPIAHDMDGAGAVIVAIFSVVLVVGMFIGGAIAVLVLR